MPKRYVVRFWCAWGLVLVATMVNLFIVLDAELGHWSGRLLMPSMWLLLSPMLVSGLYLAAKSIVWVLEEAWRVSCHGAARLDRRYQAKHSRSADQG